MTRFYGNLHLVLLAGLALAIAVIFGTGGLSADMAGANQIMRWLHVFFGAVWMGLLYYFNFVQIPTMPKIPAELKPGITQYIAPKALFFFRYSALATVATGLAVAWLSGYLREALLFQPPFTLISIGMWLALIMAFNVWVFIWPAQKIALGIVDGTPEAKAAATTRAMIFSRTNVLLSIAMLYAMVAFNGG
ncbi:MAG: hypothetical protein ABW184_03345 [Sphingobium sp.]